MNTHVPLPVQHALRAELDATPEVHRVMIVDHAEDDEPTTFKPGVLRVELRDGTPASRIDEVRRQCEVLLGRYAPFVPIACGTTAEMMDTDHPLRARGGLILVAAKSA